jgi:hypothetical protein
MHNRMTWKRAKCLTNETVAVIAVFPLGNVKQVEKTTVLFGKDRDFAIRDNTPNGLDDEAPIYVQT